MINIAICDDLPEERGRLIPMLHQFFMGRGMKVSATEFGRGEELLSSYLPKTYDLVFLDIYMDGMSGVETARLLKEKDPLCYIIFTTASTEHGADAFDVDAFHYLVKPIAQAKLEAVLEKWYALACAVKTACIKCGRGVREVFLRDIRYVEVQGRVCTVHTGTETIKTSMSLTAFEGLLPAGDFVKPIRYCLVALGHIRSVSDEIILLKNGEQIPMSRRELENVKRKLADYRLRKLRGR